MVSARHVSPLARKAFWPEISGFGGFLPISGISGQLVAFLAKYGYFSPKVGKFWPNMVILAQKWEILAQTVVIRARTGVIRARTVVY